MANCILGNFEKKVLFLISISKKFLMTRVRVWQFDTKLLILAAQKNYFWTKAGLLHFKYFLEMEYENQNC